MSWSCDILERPLGRDGSRLPLRAPVRDLYWIQAYRVCLSTSIPCKHTIGVEIVTNTILGVPRHTYGKMGPKTLFELLRPLYKQHSKDVKQEQQWQQHTFTQAHATAFGDT